MVRLEVKMEVEEDEDRKQCLEPCMYNEKKKKKKKTTSNTTR